MLHHRQTPEELKTLDVLFGRIEIEDRPDLGRVSLALKLPSNCKFLSELFRADSVSRYRHVVLWHRSVFMRKFSDMVLFLFWPT